MTEVKTIPTIKQGDAYSIPLHLFFNGDEIGPETLRLLEEIEFALGETEPVRIPAKDAWSDALQCFLLPVTQEQSFALDTGCTTLDVRVQFYGGNVLGVRQKGHLRVTDATSEVIL